MDSMTKELEIDRLDSIDWQFRMIKNSTINPNLRVFLVDNLFTQNSTARNHAALNPQGYSERKLNDGRTYNVVKIFYEPTQLQESLQNLGWLGHVDHTENFFLYGLFDRSTHNNNEPDGLTVKIKEQPLK